MSMFTFYYFILFFSLLAYTILLSTQMYTRYAQFSQNVFLIINFPKPCEKIIHHIIVHTFNQMILHAFTFGNKYTYIPTIL